MTNFVCMYVSLEKFKMAMMGWMLINQIFLYNDEKEETVQIENSFQKLERLSCFTFCDVDANDNPIFSMASLQMANKLKSHAEAYFSSQKIFFFNFQQQIFNS